MKLNVNAFALAAAAATALLWIVCSLIVMLVPDMSMTMSGNMMHSDFTGMRWSMNLAGFLVGMVLWSAFAGVIAWLIAVLYNKLSA